MSEEMKPQKKRFEVYDLKGHKVLFTPSRLKYLNDPIPEKLERYEIRHSDEGFEPCQLQRSVWVNHYGSILSYDEIPLENGGISLDFEDEVDFIELDGTMSIDEYMEEMQQMQSALSKGMHMNM